MFDPSLPQAGLFLALILILVAWTIVWKGLALWRAARNGEKVWFVALLIVNTAGILEILYLFVFSRRPATPVAPASPISTQ